MSTKNFRNRSTFHKIFTKNLLTYFFGPAVRYLTVGLEFITLRWLDINMFNRSPIPRAVLVGIIKKFNR